MKSDIVKLVHQFQREYGFFRILIIRDVIPLPNFQPRQPTTRQSIYFAIQC